MFFTYLGRELRRRRRQSLVVSLGLAVGIGLVITVSASATGVRDAQDTVLQSLYGVGTDVTVTKTATQQNNNGGRFEFGPRSGDQDSETQQLSRDRLTAAAGRSSLSSSTTSKVAGIDGVDQVAGNLTLTDVKFSGSIPNPNQSGRQDGQIGPPAQDDQNDDSNGRSSFDITSFSVEGVDLSALDVGPLTSTTTTSGRTLTASDSSRRVAVLDQSYAKQHDKSVGSKITIAGKKFTVVGIVRTTSSSGSSTSNVYISLKQAQQLADLSGKVNTLYVKATSANDVDAVKAAIAQKLPNATVSTSSDLADQVSGSLSSASSLANNLGRWLSVAVLAVAFATACLFTLSAVSRRTSELGTLKAIGWRGRRVVGQVIGESLTQGIIGGAVGIGLGYAGALLVTAVAPELSATVDTGTSAASNGGGPGQGVPGAGAAEEAARTISVALDAPVTTTVLLLAVGLAIAGGLLAGLVGGWRAERMRPAAALRTIA